MCLRFSTPAAPLCPLSATTTRPRRPSFCTSFHFNSSPLCLFTRYRYICTCWLRFTVDANWTASGRPVRSIENFMNREVLPWYGNTHTTTSAAGAQTTAYREEARRTIADAVNAKVRQGGRHHTQAGMEPCPIVEM